MRSLTDEQIDLIAEDIRLGGVFSESLQEDLLDHICCFIEEQDDERPFEEIYRQALEAFGRNGFQAVQDETLFLINQPYLTKMKKIAYISGAFASLALIAGAFFKVNHWPGANILIISGTIVMAFFFLPYFFYVQFTEQTEKKSKIIAGLGVASAALLCVGALFKILHWPGALIMLYLFTASFVIFLPLYVINGMRNPLTKLASLSNAFLFACIAGFMFLLSFQQSSKAVTDSMATINAKEEKLLETLKQTYYGDIPAQQPDPMATFIQACDAAVAAIPNDGQGQAIGNGTAVQGQQLKNLNDALKTAVGDLNAQMKSHAGWTPLVFEQITPTVYGSAKFQVMQLEEMAYVNALE